MSTKKASKEMQDLAMTLESISFGDEIARVFAKVGGKRYEFTSFRNGPVEVYDFPRSWRGLARHVGYMSNETAAKLRIVLRRDHLRALQDVVRGRWVGNQLATPEDVLDRLVPIGSKAVAA